MHNDDVYFSLDQKNKTMDSKQIKIAQNVAANISTDTADNLIESLLGEKVPISNAPATNTLESITQETYQLPVQVGVTGKSLLEGDRPWIVGTFSPGVQTDKNHPKGHSGVDLKAVKGTPVHPIASGVVKEIGTGNISGNFVMCLHEDGHVQSFYGHLDTIKTTKGQAVNKSSIIGTVGDSGNARNRGAHLHYEVKLNGSLVNPFSIVGKLVGSLTKRSSLMQKIIKLAEIYSELCNTPTKR